MRKLLLACGLVAVMHFALGEIEPAFAGHGHRGHRSPACHSGHHSCGHVHCGHYHTSQCGGYGCGAVVHRPYTITPILAISVVYPNATGVHTAYGHRSSYGGYGGYPNMYGVGSGLGYSQPGAVAAHSFRGAPAKRFEFGF